MGDTDRPPVAEIGEQLLSVREELEALTRRYIDSLLNSAGTLQDHSAALLSTLNSIPDPLLVCDKDWKEFLRIRRRKLGGADLQI